MKPLPWLAALAVLMVPAPAAATPPSIVELYADVTVTDFSPDQIGAVRVHNDSALTINSWRVEFDVAPATTIRNTWNGRFARTGNHVVVTPQPWNTVLPPGAAVEFGWYGRGTGKPTDCLINSQPCDGVVPDEIDPLRPAPLTIDTGDGVVLHWAESSDNNRLKGYEVYESGRLLTTTTDTSYVFATGNTLPPRVYQFKVRAIDAAGNFSASAYAFLGTPQIGEPPAPAGLQITPIGTGTVRLTWVQPTPPPVGPAPQIAGYEVFLDGQQVAVTGATRYRGNAPRPGTHTWSVRAIDALERRSGFGELVQVVG